jgi:hypothetical protein
MEGEWIDSALESVLARDVWLILLRAAGFATAVIDERRDIFNGVLHVAPVGAAHH